LSIIGRSCKIKSKKGENLAHKDEKNKRANKRFFPIFAHFA